MIYVVTSAVNRRGRIIDATVRYLKNQKKSLSSVSLCFPKLEKESASKIMTRSFKNPEDFLQDSFWMQRYPAVVMKIAVKVPIQKPSVYQTVTRQNAVILPPILFAVHLRILRVGVGGRAPPQNALDLREWLYSYLIILFNLPSTSAPSFPPTQCRCR